MPTGGARRGRRDNGLEATEYAVVGDVDPRVGEHLLDVLAGAGIAAYLQPASDLHPITRTSTLPARPTDRLFADRGHLQTARGYLWQLSADDNGPAAGAPGASGPDRSGPDRSGPDRSGPDRSGPDHSGSDWVGGVDGTSGQPPGRGTADFDAAWADIVAGFAVTVDPITAPWPAAEEVPDQATPESTQQPPLAEQSRPAEFHRRDGDRRDDEPSLLDALDTFGAFGSDEPDDEDGYSPPPPPPLPRISSTAVAALLAIAAGIALLFWPALLPTTLSLTLLLAFGSILGGFVTLIWRLRPGDDTDDDPDDGARV